MVCIKKKADAELEPRNLLGMSTHLAKATEPSGAQKCIEKSCLWAEWLWEPRGTARSCTHMHHLPPGQAAVLPRTLHTLNHGARGRMGGDTMRMWLLGAGVEEAVMTADSEGGNQANKV